MRQLETEAQGLCDDPRAEVMDEAGVNYVLRLLLEGIQEQVKHTAGIEVEEAYQRLHLLGLRTSTTVMTIHA